MHCPQSYPRREHSTLQGTNGGNVVVGIVVVGGVVVVVGSAHTQHSCFPDDFSSHPKDALPEHIVPGPEVY